MYRRSAVKKPRKDSAGFYTLEGESFNQRAELSDDFGTAHGPFLLVGGTVVFLTLSKTAAEYLPISAF